MLFEVVLVTPASRRRVLIIVGEQKNRR